MSSRVRSGKSRRMSSSLMPDAMYSRTSDTVIRKPRMHGLPPRFPGSIVIRDRQSTRSRYGRPEAYVNDTLYQLGRPFHPNHLSRLARDYVVAAGIAKRTEGFRFFFFSNEGREPPQVRGAAAGPGADARARVYFCGAVA